ncbi:peptidoglycan -binding protein [Paracoccus sp. Z330]|uniref:Peptidoglycan -binding protein n=1 Tax=Paracoccus onchidii TaxID=3017813 RepID=A0ABT4ZC86_9RHOB|nr:peptidoglycan -binding protein [Paracoccus onchidii]MDB6176980.1 peptidoglycan -binding protein [Paracoccus onchidii]
MALRRVSSGNRFSATIWPGFVDAMTALLLVLMFVLTIFMVVQSVLREQITTQDDTIADQNQQISQQDLQLQELGRQVSALGQALSASRDEEDRLTDQLSREVERSSAAETALTRAEAEARDRAARITRLNNQLESSRQNLSDARSRLTDFEAEVATLIATRSRLQDQARSDRQEFQAKLAEREEELSAAELAVASARREIDSTKEQARLAAARREALEALIADLRSRNSDATARTQALESKLSAAETARVTEAEAAALLRDRLTQADSELTAMTLALEESRKAAEETLTLLAAARAARDENLARAEESEASQDRQAELLSIARQELQEQQSLSADGQKRVALLNEQVASLTAQLGSLQALLDTAGDDQRDAELRVAELGQQLNAALLRAAEEKERRLSLEEEARKKAEEEARDLARYRSEFFGRLSQILSGREGVQIVGDRFVFQSEVLFAPGAADLSSAGRQQISGVADMLSEISDDIPPEIDWIIRVDGHTDSTPLSGTGRYSDNWELSQARALAVVRYMTEDLGFPSNRLAATGFSDTRPVASGTGPEALAQNRRIELKLTER